MPDVRQLEEVVAIGYGTVRKSDLTGAVSSLKMEDIEGIPLNSIEQGIQGRIAGVQVTQSSAAPDGGISMIIRGSNSMVGGTEPFMLSTAFRYPERSEEHKSELQSLMSIPSTA